MLARRHPNVRVLHGFTRERAGSDCRPALRAAARRRRGGLRLRPAGARRRGRATTTRMRAQRELRPARLRRSPQSPTAGASSFAGSGVEATTTAARCSSRPRRAGLDARARLPHGHLPQLHLPQDQRRRSQPASPARSRPPTRRTCRSASPSPSATSSSRSDPSDESPHMPKDKITLTPEQADAFGAELDALKERVLADLGERDADYIRNVIKAQRALEVGGRGAADGRHLPARLDRRHDDARAVEDPRQHGDRPQRHARPVRLDAGPGALQPRLRVGHRLPGRPVAPLPQLHAPHPHEHRGQGPRHRLRHPAHVRGRAVAARTTSATRSTRSC